MDSSFLTKVGFSVLTCNSALAIYQSHNDPGSVAFVAGAYAAIVLLFHLLRKLDNSADREARRKILAAVWALTTLLTAMFASKVAPRSCRNSLPSRTGLVDGGCVIRDPSYL